MSLQGNKCDLRNVQELESSLKKTVKFGIETISNRGPQIWNLIAKELRTFTSLKKFKKEIKKKRETCPSKICKTYI